MATMKRTDERISEVISKLVERIKEKYKPEKVILYGSYAYGVPDEDSDIDLYGYLDSLKKKA